MLASLRSLALSAAVVACGSSSSSGGSTAVSPDSAPDVTGTYVRGPFPEGTGGTLEPGSYVLTRFESYVPQDAVLGSADPGRYAMVLSLSSTEYAVLLKGGHASDYSGTFLVSGNSITLSGNDFFKSKDGKYTFSAAPGRFELHDVPFDGEGEVFYFEKK